MEWFSSQLKSSLAEAQRQATEAAEKARVLAQQASVQARALADQAAVQAKALADKASEEATRLSNAAVAAAQPTSGASPACRQPASLSPEELTRYGVTEDLLSLVSGLSYSMFSDLKAELLGPGTDEDPSATPLTPWQTQHALLVLRKAPNLEGLRFALCPRHMNDSQFWYIYFQLTDKLLPSQSARDAAMSAAAAEDATRQASSSAAPAAATAALKNTVSMVGSLIKSTHTMLSQVPGPAGAAGAAAADAQGAAGTGAERSASGGAAGSSGTGATGTDSQGRDSAGASTSQGASQTPATQRQAHTAGSGNTGNPAADAASPTTRRLSDGVGLSSPAGRGGDVSHAEEDEDADLNKYLQEALSPGGTAGAGEGEGHADLDLDLDLDADGEALLQELSECGGSEADPEDLDDYITMLDAELSGDKNS